MGDITSLGCFGHGDTVIRGCHAYRDVHPQGPGQGLNILGMDHHATYKSNMFHVVIILSRSGRLTKVAIIELKFSALVPLIIKNI